MEGISRDQHAATLAGIPGGHRGIRSRHLADGIVELVMVDLELRQRDVERKLYFGGECRELQRHLGTVAEVELEGVRVGPERLDAVVLVVQKVEASVDAFRTLRSPGDLLTGCLEDQRDRVCQRESP